MPSPNLNWARVMGEVEEVQEKMKADMEAMKEQMATMMATMSMRKIMEANCRYQHYC